jgi:hypothetical protein
MKLEALMKRELNEDFTRLGKAVSMLEYSLRLCKEIGLKEANTLEELDSFECLTSRFARTSDIYTQKVMKGIILILREEANTFIDKANLFEKLEIANSEDLKLIRDIRNEISQAHPLIHNPCLCPPIRVSLFSLLFRGSSKGLCKILETAFSGSNKKFYTDAHAWTTPIHHEIGLSIL